MNHEDAHLHLSRIDQRLASLIARSRRYEIEPNPKVRTFDSLAESIAYQQLNGRAAATIWGRVRAIFPKRKFLEPQAVLKTPDETLRAAGLSRSKVAALKDLAAKTIDGTVPTLAKLRRLSDEEILARLTSVRGIGRWTVEMLLIFHLGRPDVMPSTDYGVRKGFHRAFRTRTFPTPAQVARRAERWKPYRSVASWYLWRAIDNPAGRSNS